MNVAKGDDKYEVATGGAATQAKSHKIRITLTSKNVKNLEKGTLLHFHSLRECALVSRREPAERQQRG